MYRERTDPGSHTDRKNRTDRNEHRYYSVNVPSEKKPQECHLKKLKRTILFFVFVFSLWRTERTKGYLGGKKAGPSDSIFKTYHLISEPAFKTSKGSHYIFSKYLMTSFIFKGQLSAFDRSIFKLSFFSKTPHPASVRRCKYIVYSFLIIQ